MKVMERGQITIPKEYRDRYGIKAGSDLDIRPVEEGLLLIKKKLEKSPFQEVFGVLGKYIESDRIVEDLRGVKI